MDASIYRLRQQDILAFCVLALLCLGAIMVQSASMTVTGKIGWQWTGPGVKQAGFCVMAMAIFFFVGRVDYSPLGRRAESLKEYLTHPVIWIVLVTIALNLAVLVPGIGIAKNGARRWLPLGIMQLQPSELAKWAVVIFLAWWLSTRPLNTDRFFKGFLPTLIPICMLCLVVVIQDFGTAALIAICALTMLLAGRVKLWHLAIIIPPALAIGFWFVHHKAYRWTRMTAFVDPWSHPQKEGYHMIQSLLSFSTGGVTGRGIGNGIQKLGYLPEDTTDFIFAVICEELGLFGALLTVALFLGILYVAWQALKSKSRQLRSNAGVWHRHDGRHPSPDQHRRRHRQRADQGPVASADQRWRQRINHHLRRAGPALRYHPPTPEEGPSTPRAGRKSEAYTPFDLIASLVLHRSRGWMKVPAIKNPPVRGMWGCFKVVRRLCQNQKPYSSPVVEPADTCIPASPS